LLRITLARISAGLPVASTSCAAKSFFAKSLPAVTIAMVFPFTSELMKSLTSPSWHFDAVNRKSVDARLARDGEVPFIRQASNRQGELAMAFDRYVVFDSRNTEEALTVFYRLSFVASVLATAATSATHYLAGLYPALAIGFTPPATYVIYRILAGLTTDRLWRTKAGRWL
jgi:hypothetical protein